MTQNKYQKHSQHLFSTPILNTSQLAKCGPPVLWQAWGLNSWTRQHMKQGNARQFWRLMHWCNIHAHLQSTNSSTPTAFKGNVHRQWGSNQESTSRRIDFDLKPSHTLPVWQENSATIVLTLSLSLSLSCMKGETTIRLDQGFVTNIASYRTLPTSDLKIRTWTCTFWCTFISIYQVDTYQTPVTQ